MSHPPGYAEAAALLFGQDQGGGAAVGMALGATAGVVGAALELGLDPREISRANTKKFTMGLANLEALEAEYQRAKDLHDSAVAWLTNPANKKRWMSGRTALRSAPPASRVCPPLYPRPVYMAATGEEEAPGGHASGDPSCRCPTHKCAFKPAVRGRVDAKKMEARTTQGRMWRIQNSRAGSGYTADGGLPPQTGNIRDARARTAQAWSLLMSVDSMGSVYALQGLIAPYRPPGLTDPRVMAKIFPDDPDVAAGRVPFATRDTAVSIALSLYGAGQIPASFTLPLWAYGFTPEESRRYGVGPLIGQVATVQAQSGARMAGDYPDYQGWSAGPQGGWGELFGRSKGGSTGGVNSTIQSTVKSLLTSGRMSQVPVSPPSSIPPAQVQQTMRAIQVGENNPDPDKPGLPFAAKAGIGVAVASLLGLGAYAAFSK